MAQEKKYDVFISYSRKDSAIADEICKVFDRVGITYFIDRQGIGGGNEFPLELATSILNSQIFLLLGSKNSYESKYTNAEIHFAFKKKQQKSILPYILDDTPMPLEIDFILSTINWRKYQEHPINTILVHDVLKLLGRERPTELVRKDANIEQAQRKKTKIFISHPSTLKTLVDIVVRKLILLGFDAVTWRNYEIDNVGLGNLGQREYSMGLDEVIEEGYVLFLFDANNDGDFQISELQYALEKSAMVYAMIVNGRKFPDKVSSIFCNYNYYPTVIDEHLPLEEQAATISMCMKLEDIKVQEMARH